MRHSSVLQFKPVTRLLFSDSSFEEIARDGARSFYFSRSWEMLKINMCFFGNPPPPPAPPGGYEWKNEEAQRAKATTTANRNFLKVQGIHPPAHQSENPANEVTYRFSSRVVWPVELWVEILSCLLLENINLIRFTSKHWTDSLM